MKIKISEIKIKDRIRKNAGDIETLKESMKTHGLINPITITNNHELIAGFRRLNAAIELGWEYIDCFIIKVDSKIQKLQIEADALTWIRIAKMYRQCSIILALLQIPFALSLPLTGG